MYRGTTADLLSPMPSHILGSFPLFVVLVASSAAPEAIVDGASGPPTKVLTQTESGMETAPDAQQAALLA